MLECANTKIDSVDATHAEVEFQCLDKSYDTES